MAYSRRVFLLGYDNRVPGQSDGIFVSDTASGRSTELLALPPASGGSYPTQITTSASATYGTVFTIGSQLYATDPVSQVIDVLYGNFFGPAIQAVSLGSVAMFVAGNIEGGRGLYETDGLKGFGFGEISAGGYGGSSPTDLTVLGSQVIFEAKTIAGGGLGVFTTNGGFSGATLIARLPSGTTKFAPLGIANARLIFATADSAASHLWSTDGTGAGTQEFATVPASPTAGVAVGNGTVVYTDSAALYATDGLHAAVKLSALPPPGGTEGTTLTAHDLVQASGRLFFVVTYPYYFGTSSDILWTSDGTAAGTQSVPVSSGLAYNTDGPVLTELTAFGADVLFVALDPSSSGASLSSGLWISDGTAAGTQDLMVGINPDSIVVDGNRAFVLGSNGLYITDGTPAGTTLVAPESPVAPGGMFLDATHLGATGTHTQYALLPTGAGGLQIADLVPNRDGSATYAGATVVAFSDGVGVLDSTGNAEVVARIYQAAYGRAPDIGGLTTYTEALDNGTITLAQIASASAFSPEFISDYGNLADTAFVTQLYENADGRAPDPGGRAAYTQALASGQSRGTVLLSIGESYEARQNSIGIAGDANDASVYRLYEAVDGRAPDPAGQNAYALGLEAGETLGQLAQTFLSGPEYVAKFGLPDNTTFVTELYENLLQRAPDPGGLAAYTQALAAGTSRAAIVAAFVGGDEGRLLTAPATHDGWVFLAQG